MAVWLAAVAPIRPLAWELPSTLGAALESKKKKKSSPPTWSWDPPLHIFISSSIPIHHCQGDLLKGRSDCITSCLKFLLLLASRYVLSPSIFLLPGLCLSLPFFFSFFYHFEQLTNMFLCIFSKIIISKHSIKYAQTHCSKYDT